MPLYRVTAPDAGRHQLERWRRSVLHTGTLLGLMVGACTAGLMLLDPGNDPLAVKAFDGLWNAINLVTTVGSFTTLSMAQQQFLLATMLAVLLVGGYALTTLTGILSSPEVLAYREKRRMETILAKLSGHVVVVGYGPVGRRTAIELRKRGETVLVVEFEDEAAQAASEAHFLTILAAGARDEVHLKARVGEAIHEAARSLLDRWIDGLAASQTEKLFTEQQSFAQANLRAVESRKKAGDASALEVLPPSNSPRKNAST